MLPTDQSQPKSVPTQPGKRNFQNAPRATKKDKKMTRTDKYELHNRLTLWTENQKE